jgi:hypothetical protein
VGHLVVLVDTAAALGDGTRTAVLAEVLAVVADGSTCPGLLEELGRQRGAVDALLGRLQVGINLIVTLEKQLPNIIGNLV